jgi:hypothetical protein
MVSRDSLGSYFVPGARFSAGTTGVSIAGGSDTSPDAVLHTLGFHHRSELVPPEYSNRDGGPDISGLWYLAPNSTTLTYFAGRGSKEDGWSLNSPQRTSKTSSVSTDNFVRTIVAGRYYGYELALSFTSTCSVGALSDALGRPAFIKDTFPHSGIFDPAKIATVQSVLVKNGVTMHVRVIGNRTIPTVDSALAATTCTTANLAACESLLGQLATAGNGSVVPSSDVTKLQAGTDPNWVTMELVTSQVAILP